MRLKKRSYFTQAAERLGRLGNRVAPPSKRRMRCGLWAGLLLVGLATLPGTSSGQAQERPYTVSAQADREVPEGAALPRKGLKINIPRVEDTKNRAQGTVLWFDLEQVSYLDAKEKTQAQAQWSDLDPKRLAPFLSSLPDRKSVDSLLTVAEIMIAMEMPEDRIEHLYKSALRVDENASERIDALRAKAKGGGDAGTQPGDDGANPDNQPNQEGNAGAQPNDDPRAWPEMSEEEDAAAVKALKESTDAVLDKMGHKMGSTETERFLVYSDMPAKETKYWVGLLDKMYDELCKTFDLDNELNIWKGKCLLLFFNSQTDHLKYNSAAYGNNASGSAGICYQFHNGDVHIAMWRQREKLELAHTLVHEAVHGFLFRYQSSYYVPNWLNEGLAEFISVQLVKGPRYPGRMTDARSFVKQRGGLDNFLSAQNIIGPHYGLAFDVTDMMVDENRKGYVKMIQGIKKGLSVEEAFEEEYGATIERVFEYYGKSRLKMENLRI